MMCSQITLPGGINVTLGGTSDVQLTNTYLDEKVRIGQGSRGSLFIFKRDLTGVPGMGLCYPPSHFVDQH